MPHHFCIARCHVPALLHWDTIFLPGAPARRYKNTMNNPDHVLVVDDDLEIRSLLRDYLEKNGYRVTAVGDGKAMWAAFDEARPDIRRARRDAAGRGWPHALPRRARALGDPDHHADRARRGDRPHRRSRNGRRRLPRQAVQSARAARAHQERPAPRAHAAGQPAAGGRAQNQLRRLVARYRHAQPAVARGRGRRLERHRVQAAEDFSAHTRTAC